jgi:hypothetical protein
MPQCDPESGVEVPWTFASSLNGTPADVSELRLALSADATVQDADLHLFASNGTLVGSAATSGTSDEVLELAGQFPPGDYVVHVVGCLSAGGGFDLEGVATYVAAARPT